MFAVLMSLGFWQVRRLAWKENLLAEIAAAARNPPIPLGEAPRPFTKVMVRGRWDSAHRVLYGTDVRRDRLGAYLIEPLLREDAPPILVDRGFVADGTKVADPPGDVAVVGYIRAAEHGSWWGIKDDLREQHFYTLNATAIARAVGLAAPEPYVLVAMGARMGPPEPAHDFPELPNNHLSYAITWFSFALIDWIIFVIWVRKNWQRIDK